MSAPNLGEAVFGFIDSVAIGIADWLGQRPWTYCRIMTGDGGGCLCADDGSLITVIEVNGRLTAPSTDDFQHAVESMRTALSSRLNRDGHAMQVVIRREENADREVEGLISPMRTTARNIGLEMDDAIEDWGRRYRNFCFSERMWIVLWTRPAVLNKSARKEAYADMKKRQEAVANAASRGKQFPERRLVHLYDDHNAFVSGVSGALDGAGILHGRLSAREALRQLRLEADPEWTPQEWRPWLPGDPLPQRLRDPMEPPQSRANVVWPSVGEQVYPRDAVEMTGQVVRVGDRLHAPVAMTLPPQEPQIFNRLFARLIDKPIPWRLSFMIEGDGTNIIGWKYTVALLFTITSASNKFLVQSIQQMRNYVSGGGTVVGLRICGDTWTNAWAGGEDEAVRRVRQQSSQLAGALEGWGNSEVSQITGGDPLIGVSAALPAMTPKSPAPAAAAPLRDVVRMLPLTRPTSPWTAGILLRSRDGRPMPFQPGSSLQTSWIDIGFAPMGFGKSVLLNTINLGFVLQPGLKELPYLSTVDVGPSSKGLIDLIRGSLPPSRRHLAVYRRMRMTADDAINPFDTPLGCRKPLISQDFFLRNLVALLCTPLDAEAPPNGVEQLASAAMRAAYDELSDEMNPNEYNPNTDPEVAEVVAECAIPVDENTSWWEIVDALFEKGRIHEAIRAQRHAVPMLPDVARAVKFDRVVAPFRELTVGSETAAAYVSRRLMAAVEDYPVLRSYTKFDLGDARVIALDLDEVAKNGETPQGQRQAGLMYMLARQVSSGHFFLQPQDTKNIPESYRAWHAKRIQSIREMPKRMAFDELHRVTNAASSRSVMDQVIGDVETSGRESRKWGLSIGLYSQLATDFPTSLVNLASCVFMLGIERPKDADAVAEVFGLSDTMKIALRNVRKPGRRGSTMIVQFSTEKGRVEHPVMSTLGPMLLWAFSSNAHDTAVRSRVYARLDTMRALRALATHFPGGSAASEVERRRQQTEEQGLETEEVDLYDQMAREVLDTAKALMVRDRRLDEGEDPDAVDGGDDAPEEDGNGVPEGFLDDEEDAE